MTARSLAACAFGVLFLAGGVAAQDLLVARPVGPPNLAQYRNFALKSDLATISATAGVPASGATLIHQRPAVMKDLEFRPSRWIAGSTAASTDPVEEMVFSFYNDQLFRVVIDYAGDRTEGMTDADMVEAITAVYGTPGKRIARAARVASQIESESGSPVARWGDADHTIVLYRTSTYGDRFRLIVTDSGLDRLARKTAIEAARLDEQDAPQREIARQKKERDDGRATAEKARAANKGAFRP